MRKVEYLDELGKWQQGIFETWGNVTQFDGIEQYFPIMMAFIQVKSGKVKAIPPDQVKFTGIHYT